MGEKEGGGGGGEGYLCKIREFAKISFCPSRWYICYALEKRTSIEKCILPSRFLGGEFNTFDFPCKLPAF